MKKIIVFLLLLTQSVSVSAEEAQPPESIFNFPNTRNYDPIGGRLYLQPIGMNDDKVVLGPTITVNLGTVVTWNPEFNNGDRPRESIKTNTHVFSLLFSHGFYIKGFKLEAGGVVRTYQEQHDTALFIAVTTVHEWLDQAPRQVTDPYRARIGNNRTVVIGENGEFFITNADLYLKLQAFQEDRSGFLPNLSVKLVVQTPLSNQDFNTQGVGISAAFSKHLTDRLILLGAGGITYQDLHASDFNAVDIRVDRTVWDVFLGFNYDWGREGFFTFAGGMRNSSKRITYPSNPKSAEASNVMFLSFNYESKNKDWQYSVQLSEDIINARQGLEPDFVVEGFVTYRPKKKRYRRSGPAVP